MLLLFITTIVAISKVSSQAAYCAFNRGVAPVNENNAGTYNFLNGEFIRDYSFESGGQSDLWQGMPYYKMTSEDCFVPFLYLYRHINYAVDPAVIHWVISPNVGTKPEFAFAYCGPDSGVTTTIEPDLNSPVGACDGNWMIGDPKDPTEGVSTADHELDDYFKIMLGGCPQITCNQVKACSGSNDEWARTVDLTEDSSGDTKCTTYSYVSPNIYLAPDPGTDDNGDALPRYYMFYNIKTMRWAWHEEIDAYPFDYYNCEYYKASKGFEFVADVATGGDPYDLSTGTAASPLWFLYFTSGDTRYAKCIGTLSTPSPTDTAAPVPTNAPLSNSPCDTFTGGTSKLSPSWQAVCGLGFSPSPTVYYKLTASPISTPAPTTAAPTDQNGTAKPTAPTSSSGGSSPTSPTTSGGGSAPTADSGANEIHSNIYLLCILMAVYKMLF